MSAWNPFCPLAKPGPVDRGQAQDMLDVRREHKVVLGDWRFS